MRGYDTTAERRIMTGLQGLLHFSVVGTKSAIDGENGFLIPLKWSQNAWVYRNGFARPHKPQLRDLVINEPQWEGWLESIGIVLVADEDGVLTAVEKTPEDLPKGERTSRQTERSED